MNTSKLKSYAPKARREFINAVKARAALFGMTKDVIEPVIEQGDVGIIGGRAFPKSDTDRRKYLVERIYADGFEHVIEAMAYTWFNRFVAIRYMELHGYLEHGYRVLSHPEAKTMPEILEHADVVSFPEIDSKKIIELKLAGNKDEELYRLLLIGQCKSFAKSLPFMWSGVSDPSELLLPDNLLHTDSLISELVQEIPEEDWEQVEIIGWLYQFYVLEEKKRIDKVKKKRAIRPEELPAATQLFTPNWIVKYLVQNSLGRQWMATYPNSSLKKQMEYYIEPAEQTPEVQAKLKENTPESLNPEEMTLLDPACGSGHILVEAYDLFKAIYLERGYRLRDIPRLILEKNIFGLEIDDRAAQLSCFSLMMKARADDRSILSDSAQLNVVSIQESSKLDSKFIVEALAKEKIEQLIPSDDLFPETLPQQNLQIKRPQGVLAQSILLLLQTFENAKTIGSLILIDEQLLGRLSGIEKATNELELRGNLLESRVVPQLRPLLVQAEMLGKKYDCVVANPPYLGVRSGMNTLLKEYLGKRFMRSKNDLYSAFIEQGMQLTSPSGFTSMVTMHGWMFLSSYEEFRDFVLKNSIIELLVHLGARAFSSISGEVVQVAAFILRKENLSKYSPTFFKLIDGEEKEKRIRLLDQSNRISFLLQDEFFDIPGTSIAYWAIPQVLKVFREAQPLSELADAKQGMATSDNKRFLKFWHEVAY